MAFSKNRSGDRLLIQQGISVVPKAFVSGSYAAPWAAVATADPRVGDLVVQDTSIADGVIQCPDATVPYGIVWSVNSGNGTVSVLKLNKTISTILEVADTAGVTLGHSVDAAGHVGTILIGGQLRDRVDDLAFVAGAGLIVSVFQAGAPGLIVVEWPN